ncbi:L-serine ammonia-lyase [Sphingomicrobium lutaoense]|uniref:L-serine dehydratase n=1 Tax=Sphingomicrobium lutaoense TaxID=515949 RepID=A0A839Z495_9SPHN|nr:L-serine ammonia-lyase [Sphingomicrobium lutaoense]MBB3764425.1 L-serine dehydratase [Sphingomicrobium lutaoense]
MISALDLFRIGIGPSSSHTVGPIRIVRDFLGQLGAEQFQRIARVKVELLGSLALTGEGHGTPDACIIGLLGHQPETIDCKTAYGEVAEARRTGRLRLLGEKEIAFDPECDIVLKRDIIPALHPNGMLLSVIDANGEEIARGEYYSTGGGFHATADQLSRTAERDLVSSGRQVPYPFASAAELVERCEAEGLAICELVLANEAAYRSEEETHEGLDLIARTMMECIDAGLSKEGMLPGNLKVRRRAPSIYRQLQSGSRTNEPENLMDWLNLFAMAVNEENAAGGRVVTAPTNGAAGIIPAVMRHYCAEGSEPVVAKSRRFLLTAAGIGLLYKQRASISGAEMGCQGEVGVACSMAAGGLAAVWGGTNAQICAAAEIGMEHNLGLTCDPVGGLVQIPCIERNAIAAVKAVNAARLALHADESPRVSLDQVIETMRQTGLDMSSKYKETSLGGLAANVVAC